MSAWSNLRDRVVGGLAGLSMGQKYMRESQLSNEMAVAVAQEQSQLSAMDGATKEGLADLELAIEDVSWRDLSAPNGSWNFSRDALRKMMALSRLMYLANPLIKRAVTVQELYVWGSGCTIKSSNPDIQEVLDDFFTDPRNQEVIGEDWPARERDQRIDGNTFFAFFRNKSNGAARVRVIPVDEIVDIICNPDDSKEVWFYKRALVTSQSADLNPIEPLVTGKFTLIPAMDYNPRTRPSVMAGLDIPVEWDTRIIHVKSGGLSNMKFGMPDLFSTFNWATAYKKILENFATILAAYARVAMKISGNPGKKGVAASKSRMGTAVSGSGGQITDTNPPTNTASWFLSSGNTDIAPIKTAHSTTAPDEARALRSMVAAGSDTPEHFFGDSEIGSLATSSTLDRPTELKMVARQDMWRGVILKMSRVLIEWSTVAPNGKLRAAGFTSKITPNYFDGSRTVIITPPKNAKLDIAVKFPSIINRDVVDRVRSVVLAGTLNGRSAEGIFPDRKYLFKLILEALGEQNAEELADQYYPAPVVQGFTDPKDKMDNDKLDAQGKKDLGQAALDQAANAKKAATKTATLKKKKTE